LGKDYIGKINSRIKKLSVLGNKMDCMKKKKKNRLIVLEKEKDGEDSEEYFFKYAFPCAQVKVRFGSLSVEEYDELKDKFLGGECVNREVLERVFVPAFDRIKRLADRMGRDYWDLDVIKGYWERNHNEVIDDGEGMYGEASEDFKNLCKVHEGVVVEIREGKLVVEYGGGRRRVVSDFLVPGVKVGERVRVHYWYGVEVC